MSELTDVIQYPEKAVEKMAALLARAEKAEEEVEQWENVAAMLADELNDANSERFPLSWEDASESSPAWIAYVNLRDRRQE